MRRLARMLLAGVFVQGGVMALRDPSSRAPKAARLGLPEPELLVRVNAVTMVGGGVALALDVAPRLTAGLLIASLAPTTLAGHRFWEEEYPAARRQQLTQFMKNLAALGGLLAVVADPGQARRRPGQA